MTGYLRTPTIHGDTIVFVSDDDLWQIDARGGRADRLTAGVGESTNPRLSPDGRTIAFVGREEGQPDIYVMPAAGGSARRLTFQGGLMLIAGWDRSGHLIYATDAEQPFFRYRWLHRIAVTGGPAEPAAARAGHRHRVRRRATRSCSAAWWTTRPAGSATGAARVGDLWIDPRRRRRVPPPDPAAAATSPRRAWSATGSTSSPTTRASATSTRARSAATTCAGTPTTRTSTPAGLSGDGERLVYASGADLWLFDPATDETHRVDVQATSGASQRRRQFVPAAEHLDTVRAVAGRGRSSR